MVGCVLYCCIYYQSGALILMCVMQDVVLLAGGHLFFTPKLTCGLYNDIYDVNMQSDI